MDSYTLALELRAARGRKNLREKPKVGERSKFEPSSLLRSSTAISGQSRHDMDISQSDVPNPLSVFPSKNDVLTGAFLPLTRTLDRRKPTEIEKYQYAEKVYAPPSEFGVKVQYNPSIPHKTSH